MSVDVIYGRQPVREATRGRRAVHEILVTEKARVALPWLRDTMAEVRVTGADEIGALAGSADHQGIAARVDPFPYADPDDLLDADAPLLIALDGVSDPRNLGAIVRSAECAGANGLIVPRHGSAIVTAAVAKASAGAVEHLPIAVAPNLADWLQRAKRPGVWSYAAAADGETTYTGADYRDGCIFVLGAEGSGVRPRVMDACDQTVSIPLSGVVSSLNVSVTAGVLLFEAVRQRSQP
jgi:23S rRNA (guanosine2251-2'-O)-methyltransferase